MMPRGAPYISWTDLGTAFVRVIAPGDSERARRRVESFWAPNTVAFLSVRSGFDATLRAMAYSPGSEIIVSALTIPHILDIIAHHGLRAVPVDLNLDTLAVETSDVCNAITASTKAILVTHLFGGRNAIDELVALARARNLQLFEDCAQAYDGHYRGHDGSDVRMFSFGPIKRQTALGGGLLTFRNARDADQVRQVQASYPRQPRNSYVKRIATMAAIKCLTWRPVFNVFAVVCQRLRLDHDSMLGVALRSFNGGDLFVRLRQQPSVPLLTLLDRRLRQDAEEAIADRSAVTERVKAACPGLSHPGHAMLHRKPWLFPTLSSEPERLVKHLWRHGFDATRGSSNLACVPALDGRPAPKRAEQLIKEVLYLPLHPSASPAELRRMAAVLLKFASETNRFRDECQGNPL